MFDLLAETGEALLRLERAPENHAALLHALGLVRRVRAACGPLGLLGAERIAGAAERALGRVGRGVLAVTPDLMTSLLRALGQVEAAVAGFQDPGAAEDIDALEALAGGELGDASARSGAAAGLPPTPLSVAVIEVAGMRFAIPGTCVVAVRHPGATREGLPLVKLRDLLRLPQVRGECAEPCVVVAAGAGAVGLVTDRVLDVEQARMRQVAPMLHRSKLFSGSAVLSGGDVFMVLDPDAVADAAGIEAELPATPPSLADHPGGQAERDKPERARGAGRPRVLLVEEGGPAQPPLPPAPVRQAARFRPWWAARTRVAPQG